jgi:diguanylate cyclase
MLNKQFNLSKQLLKSVLIIYFFLTIFVTLVHFVIEYNYTKQTIQGELEKVADTFRLPIQKALWDINHEQLRNISDGLMKSPVVYGIKMIDPNGKEIISIMDELLSNKDLYKQELLYKLNINQKFHDNTIYLAEVILYSDENAVYDRIKVGIGMILLNAVIKSTALIILFVLAFRKHLETPLRKLTREISTLDWKNKNNRKIDIDLKYHNELTILQDKFNELLSNISKEEEKRYELIANLNAKLEDEVTQRTIELELANIQLKKLATTDMLTQINNRAKLEEELQLKYDNFKRNNRVFSVILMDIDYFKNINDEFGHQIGDYVLQEMANILKENIRSIDTLGRWGGEEFLIICSETDMQMVRSSCLKT